MRVKLNEQQLKQKENKNDIANEKRMAKHLLRNRQEKRTATKKLERDETITEGHLSDTIKVKYNATFKDYPNIECTRYLFTVSDEQQGDQFFKTVEDFRKEAMKHFVIKNKIKVQNDTLYKTLTKHFYIGERVLAKITDENNNTFQRLIPLTKFYDYLHGYLKEAIAEEYQTYIIPKPKYEGGCDDREHTGTFIDNEDKNVQNGLYCKSLKSKNYNCAFTLFTNVLKQKSGLII